MCLADSLVSRAPCPGVGHLDLYQVLPSSSFLHPFRPKSDSVVRRPSPGSIRNPEPSPGSAQHPESSLEAKTDPREHTAKAGKPEETRHHPKGHREAQSSPEAPQGARIQLHGTPGDGVRIRFSSGHAGARRCHRSTDRAGLRRASLSYGVAPKKSGRAGVLFYAGDPPAAYACV